MKITSSDLLLIIDVQNDFCPGGSLAVDGGNQIVPGINALMPKFKHRILTQDWHPAGHSSFASSHPDKVPFEQINMPYGPQTLWPDHCVQGTHKTSTGLLGLVQNLEIQRIFMVGLATDFCVAYSALDAKALGLKTFVINDLCRAIDLDGSLADAYANFNTAKIDVIQTANLSF